MSEESHGYLLPEAAQHYALALEAGRLFRDDGVLERERTREIALRHLPPAPADVLDIGGGAGVYAYWLAALGYRVHLVDAMPLHVEQAKGGSDEFPGVSLVSVELGDARALRHAGASADTVFLLGPLYHILDRGGRIQALRETLRVLRPGGVLLAAGVSRFASLLDGLYRAFLDDPEYREIVRQDLIDGQHRVPEGKMYFTTTFFHHPDELRDEVTDAGFELLDLLAVEGPGYALNDFSAWWDDDARREILLEACRQVEREPSLMGMSPHIIAVGRKP
jgi:SAM-dependent methyltransferase